MKKYGVGIVFMVICGSSFCQKPALDKSAFSNWASVFNGRISADGNYVSYSIIHESLGKQHIVVQSIDGTWKKDFDGNYSGGEFAGNSKFLLVKKGKDSIGLITLGRERINFLSHIAGYQLSSGDANWLAYMLVGTDKELVLRNLQTGKEDQFANIDEYIFAPDGQKLLLLRNNELQLVALQQMMMKTIWKAKSNTEIPMNYVFDENGNQLAFLVSSKKDQQPTYQIWRMQNAQNESELLLDNNALDIPKDLLISNALPEFSRDGRRLFFSLQASSQSVKPDPKVQVDVWSYRDVDLIPYQSKFPPPFLAAIDLNEKKVINLEQTDERIKAKSKDWALLEHTNASLISYSRSGAYWNLATRSSYRLVSFKDENRKLIARNLISSSNTFQLSPQGRWVIFFDIEQKGYFSYNTETGIKRNISKAAHSNWLDETNDTEEPKPAGYPQYWLPGDEAVLINDNYDIWQLDPSGREKPLNLTNGYGRKHHVHFTLAERTTDESIKKHLLLAAFDTKNKNSGFYKIIVGRQQDPELCSMGPYCLQWNGSYQDMPTKAKNVETYLVSREGAKQAPNYFVTRDFKTYTQISDVQPQKNWNWLTSELVHWKQFDNSTGTGILYKPENFDLKKKYPVIFDYYEKRSDELNLYIYPALADSRINIPWYVSRGYLVFVPDINYKIGEPGAGAYNAVVSAAKYLSKFLWVDAKHMGLQGHSWGGYETDYLVTHSHLFAAACSASGVSDLVSSYGSATRGDYMMYHAEKGQGRMGGTPWQLQKQYISNSPIFQADRVTTPTLLMNNKSDKQVPFSQGVEFFTALRRLGKRVWLLQYDDGGHGVGGKSAIDYTIRMDQFFDHYLKGAPAPKWMVEGIPAKLKGIDDGLELEPAGVTPGPGLTTKP